MNFRLETLIALTLMLSLPACDDGSSKPDSSNPSAVIKQIGGCQQTILTKQSVSDSCFSYQFSEKLSFDFCLIGNCCPDTNRFMTENRITNDTIFIAVTDTAQNLCRCNCNYTIHGEFNALVNNRYVVHCVQRGSNTEKLLYSIIVERK